MSQKSFSILFISLALTKIVGALTKIPIANILGGAGLGYFSAAYSVFSPIYALTAAAIPTVITRIVAEQCSLGNYRLAKQTRHVALRASLLIGIIGTVAVLLLTVPFAMYVVRSSEAIPSMLAIAPALMFCCVSAVYKGYYEGLRNMTPTAVSQVVESAVKAAVSIAASQIVFDRTGNVALAAAAAVFGVCIGEVSSFSVLFVRNRKFHDKITAEMLKSSPPPPGTMILLTNVFKSLLPIALGSLVLNLSGIVDLMTITSCLTNLYGSPEKANFVYGCYSGISMSLFALIPSMTAIFSKTALPEISAARDKAALSGAIERLFSSTVTLALPLCAGLTVVGEPLLALLYPSKPEEAAISLAPLIVISAGGFLIPLSGMLFSVFIATGRPDLQIKFMLAGCAVKLALNMALISQPSLNITGAALSAVACHAVICLCGFVYLKRTCEISLARFAVKPLIIAALCLVSSLAAVRLGETNLLKIALAVGSCGVIFMAGLAIKPASRPQSSR